jgi:Uma2 family endonuclease
MSDMVLVYERHRISLNEYHRMVESGVFERDSRIELIDGELIEPMTPINPLHASATSRSVTEFVRRLGSRTLVRCQVPITLPDDSEPQPDLTVARLDASGYAKRHPGPSDIFLVVEIAESSIDFDRRTKIPLYARAEIPEVWLVNLIDDTIVVYRNPSGAEYTSIAIAKRDDTITASAFPDALFAVSDLLPPR